MNPHAVGDTRMRVLLAEDHQLVREGVKLLLSQSLPALHLRIVAETGCGDGILSLLSQQPIDLLLMDLGMPRITGSSWIRLLRGQYPRLRIVVMTANCDDKTRQAVLTSGADAFLLKHGNSQVLVDTLVGISQQLAFSQSADARPPGASKPLPAPAESLTLREQQILALISQGATCHEMATRLYISPLTVRKHRENLMRKLDVHNTAELVSYALRLGLG